MVRGPKPLPTMLKLVRGDKESTFNDDEPMPDDGLPRCPVKDKLVNEVWDYTVQQMARMKIVSMADRDLLLAFCQAVVMHRRASELLDAEGYLFEGSLAITPHPAIKMQREAAMMMRQFGAEFGLTPASRTRIRVGAAQTQPAEEKTASRLLSG